MIRRALAAMAWLLAVAPAQDVHVVHTDADGAAQVRLDAYVAGGCAPGVGLGWVRLDVENVDAAPHAVEVEVVSRRFMDADTQTRRSLVLEPRTSVRLFLPLAVPPDNVSIDLSIDGASYSQVAGFHRGVGHTVLVVADRSDSAANRFVVLEALPSETPGETPQHYDVDSQGLPADWRLFTSFSAVLVDGRAAVSADVQEALRRYVHAGGRVVLATPSLLPAGPLRDAAPELFRVRELGMGQLASVGPLGGDSTQVRQALAGLRPLGLGGWPASPDLFVEQEVPGVGRPPITAFVLIILLFAIFAGPVNFRWLKRRKQPLLALVTVPVLGFGTTLMILGYGVFHDGFGVRGVHHSWTVLDQVAHEGATVSARTLFAGLSPKDLSMDGDALVLSGRAGSDSRRFSDRWRWDGDTARLDGGVLPSRTLTPLVSSQQKPVRARLTIRESGDALEVLGDSGIQPVDVIVLRDLQGDYWVGDGARLERVSAETGRRRLREVRRRAHELTPADDRYAVAAVVAPLLPDWGAPGSYATMVDQAPWISEHGLDVDYDEQRHWVFGRLAAEDFVR